MELVYLPPSLRRVPPDAEEAAAPLLTADAHAQDAHSSLEYDLVAALRPRLAVDLGAGAGHSFFTLCDSARAHQVDGLFYAIQPFADDAPGGPSRAAADAFQARLHARHRGIAYLLKTAPEESLRHFPAGSVDLLRVDAPGLGRELGPLLDAWLPCVSPGGVLVCTGVTESGPGIGSDFEARAPGGVVFPGGGGLGVWRRPSSSGTEPGPLLALLAGGPEQRADLVRFYALAARHRALAREIELEGASLRRKPK